MALKSGRVGIHPSQVDPITGLLLVNPSGASSLTDLDDINISDPQDKQTLEYDASTEKWVNVYASISPVTPATLASLSDVEIEDPEVGQTLQYNGTGWENVFASISPVTPATLASLTDVDIDDPSDGEYLMYDGTSGKWINSGEAPTPTYTDITLTLYSAVEDLVSFTDAAGVTHTEQFAENQSSKSVTFKINPSGSTSIIFTSSVAKNPDNLSAYYSKTVIITSATTSVYLMPDNVLYWWGYQSDNLEICNTANGWQHAYTFVNPTFNKRTISFSSGNNQICGVGTKNSVSGMTAIKTIAKKNSGSTYVITKMSSKNLSTGTVGQESITSSSDVLTTLTANNEPIIGLRTANATTADVSALWYE